MMYAYYIKINNKKFALVEISNFFNINTICEIIVKVKNDFLWVKIYNDTDIIPKLLGINDPSITSIFNYYSMNDILDFFNIINQKDKYTNPVHMPGGIYLKNK